MCTQCTHSNYVNLHVAPFQQSSHEPELNGHFSPCLLFFHGKRSIQQGISVLCSWKDEPNQTENVTTMGAPRPASPIARRHLRCGAWWEAGVQGDWRWARRVFLERGESTGEAGSQRSQIPFKIAWHRQNMAESINWIVFLANFWRMGVPCSHFQGGLCMLLAPAQQQVHMMLITDQFPCDARYQTKF